MKNKATSLRNSKCSCGSGLKYKKCCLLKKREQEQREMMMRKHEAVINSKCPECDSGKKWKDCCLLKHLKENADKDTKLRASTGVSTQTRSRAQSPILPMNQVHSYVGDEASYAGEEGSEKANY